MTSLIGHHEICLPTLESKSHKHITGYHQHLPSCTWVIPHQIEGIPTSRKISTRSFVLATQCIWDKNCGDLKQTHWEITTIMIVVSGAVVFIPSEYTPLSKVSDPSSEMLHQ